MVGNLATEFKRRLKSGEINPEKLAKMSSKQRREYFASFLGEDNAKNVNSLFERKLLAKRRWDAMMKWAKQTTGIKPEARRDLIAKIERMAKDKNGNLLTPQEEKEFLSDLASTKLGVDVTAKESEQINKLSSIIEEKKAIMEKNIDNTDNRIAYGNALIDMYDYVAELKPGMSTINQIANIANLPRAMMSTMDFSAPFRQGFGLVSRKAFWKNLVPMFKAGFNEKHYRDIQADIISRPNYQTMKRSGLRLSGLGDKLSEREEAFMTNMLDEIPLIRGSERAYTAFLSKLRADAYDDLLRKAEMAGEDIKPGGSVARDLANVVNNFTGAGRLINSAADTATPIANAVFFSPRKIAATIQKFNPNNYLNPNISATARKEAFRNLIGMVGASTAILSLAKLAGAEVETDPRSSDFGKVQINNTRFDVTGGDGSFAVLIARLITGQTKSTTSDIIRTLGEDYGAPTRGDTLVKYFRNKLSPTASFVADWLYGTNAIGEPFDVKKGALTRVVPLIIQTAVDTAREDPSMAVPAVLADMFGFGTGTYGNNVDWNNNTGKELSQFKEKVGQDDFNKANSEYNRRVEEKVKRVLADDRYKQLSDADKLKTITKLKKTIKADIYKSYKFKYQQEKTKENSAISDLAK